MKVVSQSFFKKTNQTNQSIKKFSIALFLLISSIGFSQNYIVNPTTDGGFEGLHGWTILNTSNVNKWIVGNQEKTAGSFGAYISNNNLDNTLTNPQDTNSKVYIYKDVIVPLNATSITISFKYKNAGTDAPAPRCLFELTSACPALPSNGASQLVGSEFATFLNNALNWTTYNNSSPLSSDRLLTYTSENLIPGESYRIVFEWSASYQTNLTQQAPFCTYPTSASLGGNMTPTPNSTEVYTFVATGGGNYICNWTVVGCTILSGQGTSQITVSFPSNFTNGNLSCSLSCPPRVYTSDGKNSGPLAIDEVAITYIGAPKITSFSPLFGAVGSSVTINGDFFGSGISNNIVYLGGAKCTITAASSTSLTVTVPSNANFSNFTVLNTTTNLGCTSGNKFVPNNTALSGMSYSSNGLTSFESPVLFGTGTFATSMDQKFVLSDVDLDGKMDVFSYATSGFPQILRNTAISGIVNASTFAVNSSITTVSQLPSGGYSPKGVLTSDLNNDGKLDFAMSNSANNGGFVNINNSTSGTPALNNFNSLLSTSGAYQVNAAFLPIDINLDGRNDIFGINGSASPALLYFTKNTTSGTTFSSVSGNTANLNSYSKKLNDTGFSSGASGDLDGDGKVDVVLSGSSKIYVLVNTTVQGNPDVKTFSFSQPISKANASGTSNTVKLADLDSDGKLDVIATNSTSGSISVYRNNTSAGVLSLTDAQNVLLTGFTATNGLAIADMNGDGKPDILVSDNSSKIGYLENTSVSGTITFAASVTVVSSGAYPQIEVADIDGDNKPDIIAANATNSIVVFRNRVAEAGTISDNQTICYNTIPSNLTSLTPATFTAVGGTIAYKWQYSDNGGITWSDFVASNTLGYTITGVLSATRYYRRGAAHSTAAATYYFTNPIIVTVTANPSITATTPATACGNSSVTLGATSSGGAVNWYNLATGGTLLGTGSTFTTPSLSSTTTYYVSAATPSGCISTLGRTAVAATIISTVPTLTAYTAARCDTGSVTLSALLSANTTFGGTINWFAGSSGGTAIGTGASFVTPSISATTIFYVEANNCNGNSTRTAVNATVVNTPSIISTVPNAGCKNSNVVLAATGTGGSSLSWYTAETGGSSSNATVNTITANTNRYVSAYITSAGITCEGPRTAVTATMYDLPATPTGTGASLCGTGTATLTATSATGVITWYSTLTGTTLLGSGTTYTPPAITSNAFTSINQNYFASAKDINGCISTPRATVTLTYDGPKANYLENLNAVTNSTNQKFTATGLLNQTSFIWQRSIDFGTTWQDITANLDAGVTYSGFSGTTDTTSSLTLSVALPGMHLFQYRMKLIKSSGCENYSNTARLFIADVFGTCSDYPSLSYSVIAKPQFFSGSYPHWEYRNFGWYSDWYPSSTGSYNYTSASVLYDNDGTSGYNLGTNGFVTVDFGSTKLVNSLTASGFSWQGSSPLITDYANPIMSQEEWGYDMYGDWVIINPSVVIGYNQYPDPNLPLTTQYGPDWSTGSTVEVSPDNINFTTLTVVGTFDPVTHKKTFTFPTASGRYLRIKNPNSAGISELRIYFASFLNSVPYIKTLPDSQLYISAGGGLTQTVVVSPSAGKYISNYQWSNKIAPATDYSDIYNDGYYFSGAYSNALTFSNFDASIVGNYKIIATQNDGCVVSTISTTNLVAPYYSSNAGSGALQTLTSWGTNANGVGPSAAPNFNADKIFILANSTTTGNYTFGANWTVAGTLRLNTKKLTLGNFNATIATIQEASTSSYVVTNGTGKLISNVNFNSKLFPVGTTTTYNPVTISNNTGTVDNYSVGVSNTVLANGTSGALLNNVINKTWTINKTAANTAGTGSNITFEWNSGDVVGTVNTPKLFAFVSGTGWVEQNNAGSITSTATSLTYSGYRGALANTLFMISNPIPVITSFLPTSAGNGVSVIITGTGLSNASTVSFGGTAATSFVVNSDTQITAVVSTGTTGSVSVTTLGGTATLAGFTFIPAPTITYFSPNKTNAGQTVSIYGTNFLTTNAVSFGGTPAYSFTIVSNTLITAVVGTGTSGNVVVTTSGGTATASGFVYGIPYTSIDVLAGWNITNTTSQVYPYAATYKMDAFVSSASNNYSGITTSSNSNMAWVNNNSSASLDTATAPYLSFSIALAAATKFERVVFPGLKMTTSKMQVRWNVDNYASSLGEIASGNGTDLLASINLVATAMQMSGTIEFRVYFYNGNADVVSMKAGNSFASIDGTAPTYNSTYAIAFYGASKPAPTIGTVANINKNLTDPAFVLPLPSSNSNGAFTYSSSNTAIISINGSMATINGIGTATITATQAASDSYGSGSTTFTISVKTIPTLFLPNMAALVGGSAITLNATSNSNGAITYSSGSTGVASILNSTLTIAGVGASVITVTQAASGNYTAATYLAIITVGNTTLINPTLSNFANINKMMSNPAFSLTPPTSNSPGGFTYYSSNAQVATNSSLTITLVGPGISIITAVQTASGNYRAASISAILTVGLASNNTPVITSLSPITKYVNDAPFTLTAPTSTSSEAFVLFSSTPTVGSISGTTATVNGLGVSTITAMQPAGGGFNAGVTSTTMTVIDLLPAISYTTPNTLIKNTAMTNLLPTSTGGSVASYSIAPSLPPGLAFNATTGVISGTPIGASALTNYTVTATNSTGTSTAILAIKVNDIAPDSFTYPTPNVYTAGTSITALNPTFTTSTGGDVISFTVSPALPAGLIINPTTGKISGVPNTATPLATYVVTATNSGGTKTFSLSITVNDTNPSGLEYSTPNVLYNGLTIDPLIPSNMGGAIVSYAVLPVLPSGLALDTDTGIITGAPDVISPETIYRITGTNSSGQVYKDISLLVSENAPTNLVYTTPNSFVIGSAITPLTPTSSGGVPTSYSITPTLPAGLTFNTTTGEISGTPTALSANATYEISAINFIGRTTSNVEIAIIDIAMSNLVYSSPVYYLMNETIAPNTPTISGGTVVSYSVSPSLPAGLTMDTVTGIISGTPTVNTPAANYTITALNSVGTTRVAVVRIGVNQFCGSFDN